MAEDRKRPRERDEGIGRAFGAAEIKRVSYRCLGELLSQISIKPIGS